MAEETEIGPRLYFVRHGETAWSLTRQHTGSTDLPLTETGEAQARALAPWLRAIDFAHVLTSPLQRARRTCILAGLGPAAHIEPDLAEWNYGDYEGKLSSDIRKQRPDWNAFKDGCPGGEMPVEISARADRLIRHLCALRGNVALFSHGEFAGVLAARWISLPVSGGAHFSLDTASLSILAQNPNHPDVRAISLWNAVPAMLRK
jgi:probable phosphoglycerate mutase